MMHVDIIIIHIMKFLPEVPFFSTDRFGKERVHGKPGYYWAGSTRKCPAICFDGAIYLAHATGLHMRLAFDKHPESLPLRRSCITEYGITEIFWG